jgi:hypothetical protein
MMNQSEVRIKPAGKGYHKIILLRIEKQQQIKQEMPCWHTLLGVAY